MEVDREFIKAAPYATVGAFIGIGSVILAPLLKEASDELKTLHAWHKTPANIQYETRENINPQD